MTEEPPDAEDSVVHYFVDEAGDPALFNAKGHQLVGSEGCSKRFILGKLHVAAPERLTADLNTLRTELVTDPYFYNVPSMQPEDRKTTDKFHAKDDLPEVRREVFRLLAKHDLRFYAVIRDKQKLTTAVLARNQQEPTYRYRENDLYDDLTAKLFEGLSGGIPAEQRVCFSARGSSDRTKALAEALNRAEETFAQNFGFSRPTRQVVTATAPASHGGLQAVDYYLWALQRFFERDDDRYIRLVWPQVAEVRDLDAPIDEQFYRQDRALISVPKAKIESKKKKKPRL